MHTLHVLFASLGTTLCEKRECDLLGAVPGLQLGLNNGDHVLIMGNPELIRDVVAIVSGHGDELVDKIVSNLPDISARVSAALR